LWLKEDLRKNERQHVFVFFHEPAFPIDEKEGESLDYDEDQRDKLWEILDAYPVTVVFSGHEHLHSRRLIDEEVFPEAQNEIYQFITGNTNYFDHDEPDDDDDIEGLEFFHQGEVFMTVSVDGSRITTRVYTVEGKLIEEFQVR
jgi:hypothetical protein